LAPEVALLRQFESAAIEETTFVFKMSTIRPASKVTEDAFIDLLKVENLSTLLRKF
jgi:hypothetical protein